MANWKRYVSKGTGKPILVNLDVAQIIRPDLDEIGTLIYFEGEEPVHVNTPFRDVAGSLGRGGE